MSTRISIDDLIEIVKTGGKVKTGVDVYNKNGILLLDKNVLVDKVKILEIIRENGINSVPVNQSLNGGLWDGSGNLIRLNSDGMIDIEEQTDSTASRHPGSESPDPGPVFPDIATNEIEIRLLEIEEIKNDLVKMVREKIGPIACLRETSVVDRLPKTRSGKILRGTMRSIANGKDYRMPSTIDDPTSLEEITGALENMGYPKQ